MPKLNLGEKAALVVGTGVGVGVPRILERLDAYLAINATKNGDIKDPETYAMYKRPGILVPFIAGVPMLLAGLLADEYFEKADEGPALQGFLLTTGTGMTVGGIDNLATALDGRNKAGVPLITPDPTVQYSAKCVYRSIGGPGYMVGCGGTLAAGTPIVDDPPIQTGTQVRTPPQRPQSPSPPRQVIAQPCGCGW